jgi:hypothetical protein
MTRRRWLIAAGAALIVAGGFLSVGAPRTVLLNESLRIEYPWIRSLGAFAAAAGAAFVAAVLSPLAFRLVAGVLSLAALVVSLHLFRYRLDATDAGLVSRGVLGTTAIAWKDVSNVDQGPDLTLVTSADERIRVDTTDFSPDQRATLERAIARHVREHTSPR